MALIFATSASHRGTDKIFAAQTQYSALEAYGDLEVPPVASFPLRDVILNTRLRNALLDSVKANLLTAIEITCSWMYDQRKVSILWAQAGNPAWRFPAHYATEHGRDLAARILINEALSSFFGSYLRSKVDLTAVNENLFYDKDVRLVPLAFKALHPDLALVQVQREFTTFYQPDASILELTGRVFDDTRVFDTDLAARFSLACGAVILAYYLEGRA